ncbi:glucans biosynthesis glucosyltransferase MdoH [Devosia sp.]|uniref:glucans biosynthesis glucosyltransferase MdoH n=1 Tax=Devosia sp. TaxID=1871048 RepID=UPI003A95DBDC
MYRVPLRPVLLTVAAGGSVGGGWLYFDLIGRDAPDLFDGLRAGLFTVTLFWLIWGGMTGLLGALLPRPKSKRLTGEPVGRTAILVPIYHEDPAETFSRIAAMNRSLVAADMAAKFHFIVLSDSQALKAAADEAMWFERLVHEPLSEGRIFYRRRERNTGRKAGNIEDFVVRSGAAYDYALILDADSLMDGDTIVQMALRMDAEPRLGLLQSVPVVIGAKTLFGRVMAYASAYLSPYFSLGAARIQGEQGPYWGHNAIVRLTAFAASCGLPELGGKPPGGGQILSHDYVEAALLARAGWQVMLDPNLGGSFENGPENLIEYAKRDRRWCQGNLQHRRLIGAPGLHCWSRFTFLQGMMAYLASPLWLALLAASLLAAALPDARPGPVDARFHLLAVAVISVLLLPKLVIFLRSILDGHSRRFGGGLRVGASVVAEILLSTILAPVLMCFQTRAVFEFYSGLDGGWPATQRDATRLSFHEAWRASWWIVASGSLVLALALVFAPAAVAWLLPVLLPAIGAPLLIVVTSMTINRRGLFQTAVERDPPPIVRAQQAILQAWTRHGPELPLDPMPVSDHVSA